MRHANDDYAFEVRRRSLAAIPGAAAPFSQRARTMLTVLTPRLAVGLLWLLTHWFDGLFVSLLLPITGFLLLPITLLWYSAVQQWFGGVWTMVPVMGFVVALLIDLSALRGPRRASDLHRRS